MPQIPVPTWRPEPVPVWLNCDSFHKWESFEDYVVQFNADGTKYTAFVPYQYCDPHKKVIKVHIVADCEEGLLVDLPAETLTSGTRILVRETERKSVLQEINYDSQRTGYLDRNQ